MSLSEPYSLEDHHFTHSKNICIDIKTMLYFGTKFTFIKI